jgi:hypothetical protein
LSVPKGASASPTEIRHGADWFAVNIEEVQKCDSALILLTPASVREPWILWEAGAVHAYAVSSSRVPHWGFT